METPRAGFVHRSAQIALLFALPLGLRLAPIEHGMPRNYVPDTHIVRCALGMAKDKDLVPPVAKYSTYPYFLPYLLLPAYATQYALGKAGGAWSDSQTYGDHLLEHPEDAQRVARWLVALFGALTPWVVYRATRAAGLSRGAWIAAFLAATSLLQVQLSVHERPWVPLAFFMALAAWPAALYAREARMRWLVLSGITAGLSFACHQGGLGALAIPGLAWLFGPLGWRGPDLLRRWKQGVASVALFAIVALLLGHPYFLRYGPTDAQHSVGGEMAETKGGLSLGGLSVVFGTRLDSFTRLSRALLGYDPLVLALGLFGLGLALRVRTMRAVCVFTILWAAFFMTQQSDHVRYLLPVTLFLCWPAGLVAERWMQSAWSARAIVVLLAFPLVQVLRFDRVMRQPDTREQAEIALSRLGPGAVVAIDRYGPDVDLDQKSLLRLERLRSSVHDTLRARERHRLNLLEGDTAITGAGIDALHVEEVLDVDVRERTVSVRKGLESLGTDARRALASLGVTHILLVDRRPGLGLPRVLHDLVDGQAPILIIDPSASAQHLTKECFLPTEMDFPLEGLWSVNEPGPWMALYALR